MSKQQIEEKPRFIYLWEELALLRWKTLSSIERIKATCGLVAMDETFKMSSTGIV